MVSFRARRRKPRGRGGRAGRLTRVGKRAQVRHWCCTCTVRRWRFGTVRGRDPEEERVETLSRRFLNRLEAPSRASACWVSGRKAGRAPIRLLLPYTLRTAAG